MPLSEDVLGLLAREYLRDDSATMTLTQIKRTLDTPHCTCSGRLNFGPEAVHRRSDCLLGAVYALEERGLVERGPVGAWHLSPRAEDAALRLVRAP